MKLIEIKSDIYFTGLYLMFIVNTFLYPILYTDGG